MAGEIERAAETLNARKEAILDGLDGAGAKQVVIGDGEQVRLLSGFDLDPAELLGGASFAAKHGVQMVVNGGGVVNPVFSSLWIDGLAMGLLIAEARARKTVSS